MNNSYYGIALDIKSVQSQVTFPVKQGDTSRGINIILTDGGKAYFIERNCSATFKGEKSDGKQIKNICTIKNNRIVYPITEQTVASPGIVDCEVSLFDPNGNLITTPRFTLIVDSRVGGDEYESTDEYNALEHYLSDVEKAEIERQSNEEARKNALATVIDENSTHEQYASAKATYDYGQNIIKTVDSPELWKLEAGLYKVTTGFYTTETNFVSVSSNPEQSCYVHIMHNYNGFAFYMRSSYEMVLDAAVTEQGICPSFEWGITNGTTWDKGLLQNNSFIVEDSGDIETYSKSKTRFLSVRAFYNYVTNKLALKENIGSKVLSITDENNNDGLHYPTVKAVVDYIEKVRPLTEAEKIEIADLVTENIMCELDEMGDLIGEQVWETPLTFDSDFLGETSYLKSTAVIEKDSELYNGLSQLNGGDYVSLTVGDVYKEMYVGTDAYDGATGECWAKVLSSSDGKMIAVMYISPNWEVPSRLAFTENINGVQDVTLKNMYKTDIPYMATFFEDGTAWVGSPNDEYDVKRRLRVYNESGSLLYDYVDGAVEGVGGVTLPWRIGFKYKNSQNVYTALSEGEVVTIRWSVIEDDETEIVVFEATNPLKTFKTLDVVDVSDEYPDGYIVKTNQNLYCLGNTGALGAMLACQTMNAADWEAGAD